jgi:DNA polymerase V
VSCIPLERAPAPRRSITHSRSFGRRVRERAALREAVAAFTARAAEKARALGLAAGALHVFVVDDARHGNGCTVRVTAATNATPPLIAAAARALDGLWRPGTAYVKAGVLLFDLSPTPQGDLFAAPTMAPALYRALDAVNRRFGRDAVVFASTGVRPRGARPAWRGQRALRSRLYTTRWTELPVARA